jgi:hypothetical protein
MVRDAPAVLALLTMRPHLEERALARVSKDRDGAARLLRMRLAVSG